MSHPTIDFAVLVNELPDLIAIADRSKVVFANPAWHGVLGWSSTDVLEMDFLSLVHPEDHDETVAELQRVWAGVSSQRFRNRLRTRGGDYVWIRWSLVARGDLLHASGRDITDYRTIRDQLSEANAVSQGVLQTAIDPIIVIDADGSIVEANQATSSLFGYPADKLVGNDVSMLMPEPYRSEHGGYLEAYLTGGEPQVIGLGREVEARRADGTVFPMSLAVSEVFVADRRLFTGIIHDLSERNRQRDELTKASVELERRVEDRTAELASLLRDYERSNEDLERFAYIASHDLQAPLRNVRQGLELLDEHLTQHLGIGFDDEATELSRLVVGSVGRMEALITGLLAYSRVQRAEDRPHELVDLSAVASEVLAVLAPELDDVGAAVSSGPWVSVIGHRSLLTQVLQNLVGNAIRYRSPHRHLAITLSAETHDDMVEVVVADNGLGIAEAQHERVFEMFRRGSHEGHSSDGVGIGLAICRRIVEGHDGSITVSSVVDEGSSFHCYLPARPRTLVPSDS